MKKHTGQDRSVTTTWRPTTQAVRGGTARSDYGETSEAIFLTSGYAYDCAADAAARFAGDQVGMTYSRLQNPTVEMLENRIALLEECGLLAYESVKLKARISNDLIKNYRRPGT